jgi:lysozyme
MRARIASLAVVLLIAPTVALYEGVVLSPYADPVGIETVCAGETDREVVSFKSHYTRDECMALLGASLLDHARKIEPCIRRDIPRHQAAAVLSWSYNVGSGAACGSTLVRKLNAGEPFCAELDRWVYAKGLKLPGLVRRRAEERAMCEGRWTPTG